MSTLHVVEEVLRERGTPMVVRAIVEAAGERLPTKSKTPDTVVARDLAMDIKRRGDESKFIRTSPGHYTLRELAPAQEVAGQVAAGSTDMVAEGSSEMVSAPNIVAPAELLAAPLAPELSAPEQQS